MPKNLLAQLDRYGDHVDQVMDKIVERSSRPAPVEIPQADTMSRESRLRGRPGWVVAASAAALVLLVVGGTTLLLRPGSQAIDQPAATDIPVTSAPVPEPTQAPDPESTVLPGTVAPSVAPAPPPTSPPVTADPSPPPTVAGFPPAEDLPVGVIRDTYCANHRHNTRMGSRYRSRRAVRETDRDKRVGH